MKEVACEWSGLLVGAGAWVAGNSSSVPDPGCPSTRTSVLALGFSARPKARPAYTGTPDALGLRC